MEDAQEQQSQTLGNPFGSLTHILDWSNVLTLYVYSEFKLKGRHTTGWERMGCNFLLLFFMYQFLSKGKSSSCCLISNLWI